jgi:hypothetical protein
MTDISNITCIIEEMDLTKLSKPKLLVKCNELGLQKYKSKNKSELIELINSNQETQPDKIKLIIEDDTVDNSDKPIQIIQSQEKSIPKLEINADNFKIINGDCLVEMKKIKDASIDMILCDLPYGMTKNSWDIVIPFDKLWDEYNRIIKDNGAIVLFGSQPFTTLMISPLRATPRLKPLQIGVRAAATSTASPVALQFPSTSRPAVVVGA